MLRLAVQVINLDQPPSFFLFSITFLNILITNFFIINNHKWGICIDLILYRQGQQRLIRVVDICFMGFYHIYFAWVLNHWYVLNFRLLQIVIVWKRTFFLLFFKVFICKVHYIAVLLILFNHFFLTLFSLFLPVDKWLGKQ